MFVQSFESEERSFKNRKTSWAAFITLFLHGLILLFLILTILTPPDPPYTDSAGGVAVSFGTDDAGSGDVQPMTLTPIAADFSPAPAAASTPSSSAAEDIATQDLEDAPVIEKTNTEAPKPKPNENALFKPNKNNTTKAEPNNSKATNNTPPAPTTNSDALFTKGAKGNPNNSKGDGTGGGKGDQGKPDGDPNSKNYLGDGDGNGSGSGKGDLHGGFSLKGRNKVALPPPTQCSSKGKVVVSIRVDRNGRVVEAKLKRFESTVFDECNVNNALSAARKSTFTPDTNAPEIQEGTITYIYKVN